MCVFTKGVNKPLLTLASPPEGFKRGLCWPLTAAFWTTSAGWGGDSLCAHFELCIERQAVSVSFLTSKCCQLAYRALVAVLPGFTLLQLIKLNLWIWGHGRDEEDRDPTSDCRSSGDGIRVKMCKVIGVAQRNSGGQDNTVTAGSRVDGEGTDVDMVIVLIWKESSIKILSSSVNSCLSFHDIAPLFQANESLLLSLSFLLFKTALNLSEDLIISQNVN